MADVMITLGWSFLLAYLLTSSVWLVLGWDQDEPQGDDREP